MEKVEIAVYEECAPKAEQIYNVGPFQAESLERHRAVGLFNCSWMSDSTFNRLLKCLFVVVVTLSVFSDLLLWLLPNLPDSPVSWRAMADLTWPLIPTVTGWKANVLLIMFAAAVYVGAFLRKMKNKKTTGSAERREEVPTVSASIQKV